MDNRLITAETNQLGCSLVQAKERVIKINFSLGKQLMQSMGLNDGL